MTHSLNDFSVMDLPIVLKNMISTLMNTCGAVSSWNVYENSQDFDKSICCASMDSQACPVTLPVAYKNCMQILC